MRRKFYSYDQQGRRNSLHRNKMHPSRSQDSSTDIIQYDSVESTTECWIVTIDYYVFGT
jgi:hypothetical protein